MTEIRLIGLLYPFHIPLDFRGEQEEHNTEQDCCTSDDTKI